jgi:hypothetical protein
MEVLETLGVLLLIAAASGTIVDVWFNGSIFSEVRAIMEAKLDPVDIPDETTPGDDAEAPIVEELPRWLATIDRLVPRWLAELLCCPLCLSVQVPLWLWAIWGLSTLCLQSDQLPVWATGHLLRWPLYAFTATRLAWIANGLLPENLRYLRGKDLEDKHE